MGLRVNNLVGFGAGGVDLSDPYWSSVTLLLLMDGADTSTTFTDSSDEAQSVTAEGNAQQDDAQAPTGMSTSGAFDGTGDDLTMTYSTADFRWWDADCTMEAYVRTTTLKETAAGYPLIMGCFDPTATVSYFSFGSDAGGALQFQYYNGSHQQVASADTQVAVDTWYHMAMVLDGSDIRLYLDGVQKATAAVSGTPQDAHTEFAIGQSGNVGHAGWVSNLRFTKGVCRYPDGTTFTPPSLPLPTS